MRYRPNLDFVGGMAIKEVVDKIDPDKGSVVTQNFFPQLEVLPSAELFDLETMIKAGVPLQKTSTKIVGTDLGAVADALMILTQKINLNKRR